MSSGDPSPRRPRVASTDSFVAGAAYALLQWGRKRSNRLDDFEYSTANHRYSAVDIMTSVPYLRMAIHDCASTMASAAWEHLGTHAQALYVKRSQENAHDEARELQMELHRETYVPRGPQRKMIPKLKLRSDIDISDPAKLWAMDLCDPGSIGKTRPLTIPDRLQRVVGKAAVHVLNDVMSQRWGPSTIGSRPGIGLAHILQTVKQCSQATDRTVVLAFDISGFFDNVSYERCLQFARDRIGYDPRGKLGQYLEQVVLYREPGGVGLPQGSPISPLLSNLFAEEAIDTEAVTWGPFLRYLDDGLLFCRSIDHAAAAYAAIASRAKAFGLSLHPEKTQIIDLRSSTGTDMASSAQRSMPCIFLGVGITAVNDGIHVGLTNRAIATLIDHLRCPVEATFGHERPVESLIRDLKKRFQIWEGWMHSYGALEWTPLQVAAVQAVLELGRVGGASTEAEFSSLWDRYVGVHPDPEEVQHWRHIIERDLVGAELHDGGKLSLPVPDVAAWRSYLTETWWQVDAMAIRWIENHGGKRIPQWTASKQPRNAIPAFIEVQDHEFDDRFADGLPVANREHIVSLGTSARPDHGSSLNR